MNTAIPTADVPSGMVHIPGGNFTMGSDEFYPEEQPAHRANVSSFFIDVAPVTVAQFAEFVENTGYITVAEQPLRAADFPGLDPELLAPGALVFRPTSGPVPLHDPSLWWSWVLGASWRHPEGPGSDALEYRADHPVTQVCYDDAAAYATWVGKRIPTEAEHEFAARGGNQPATYAWGDERFPDGQYMANTWHGSFPYHNTAADGWAGTSPVASFPANAYGAVDLIGNVWEWTADRWSASHPSALQSQCCVPADPHTRTDAPEHDRATFVVKGGSHLCAPEYCLRYRPAARQPQERDSATTHLGFRCAQSP